MQKYPILILDDKMKRNCRHKEGEIMNETVPEKDFLTKKRMRLFCMYYKPNIGLFILDMSCAFLIACIDLLFPMVTRFALQTYLPNNNYRTFFLVISILFVSYIVRFFMQFVVSYWGHLMGANIEMQMRYDLFNHLQKLSYSFFDRSRTGSIMSRILPELFDITELAHHGPEDLFISCVTMIGASIALFIINPKLALILILAIPILITFTILLRKRMSFASRHLKEGTAEINSEIESCITGVRVSKAFANEGYQATKFQKQSMLYRTARCEFYKVMAVFFSGMEFMISLVSLIAIGAGGYFIMKNEMTLVDLVAFTLYITAFLTPIRKLTNFTELFQSGMSGFDRFIELMKETPDIVNCETPLIPEKFDGNITFSHVNFAYTNASDNESNDTVLSDINLIIPAGKTIAIVGPSGGGKSTLCHLIPRFYEISSGSISIDQTDIRNLDITFLRQNIGIVLQDVFLFATTIMENIRFGRLDASDEEVMEAARQAEMADFIDSLPDGYNTYVGERGLLLSGGQKQRISIARVFLKNPKILILDEATSALDTQTERKIQSALERLSHGRTCIVIAHRLSTIRNADRIVYLSEKGIEEQGTHEELIAISSAYSNLYNLQISC